MTTSCSKAKSLTPEQAREIWQAVQDNMNGVKHRPDRREFSYWMVENTSWGGVNHWFPARKNCYEEYRFDDMQEAMDFIARARKLNPEFDYRAVLVKSVREYTYVESEIERCE